MSTRLPPAASYRSAGPELVSPTPVLASERRGWQRSFTRAVVISDLTAVVVATAVYALFGTAEPVLVAEVGLFVLALSAGWLAATRAWDSTVLGQGTVEFARLLNAVVGSAVTVGLLSLAFELPRGGRGRSG